MTDFRDETSQRTLRSASLDDLAAITEIYNQAVVERSANADFQLKDPSERLTWFQRYDLASGHPLLVWEEDGRVLAYAGLSRFREKPGYIGCAEMTLYVHQQARGRGIGRSLGEAVVELGRELGQRVILALVFADNSASNGLFSRLGFSLSGHFPDAVQFPDAAPECRDVGIWHFRL